MPVNAGTSDSVENIKAGIIHGNYERLRRAVIAVFAGETVFTIIAWFFLGKLLHNFTIPVDLLRWLIGCAAIVNLLAMSIVFVKKKFHLATSIMAIFYSVLFIPTLFLSGGFISPFSIVYLLVMMLSIVMVDVIPPAVGKVSSGIIIGGYVGVSLAQKAGFQPVVVDYVQPLLQQEYFFWFVFITVSFCFLNGYVALNSSSKNIRETLTQFILTYRYVAKGTSLFISDKFIPDLLNALVKALQVKKVFLIEWTNKNKGYQSDTDEGKVTIAEKKRTEERVIKISDEFKSLVAKAIFEDNHSLHALSAQLNSYLNLEFTPLFDYWAPIYDSAGDIVGVLGAADQFKNTSQGVLASDIMHIFSSRISAEIARRIEEKKRLHMQNLLSQGQKMQAIGQLSSSIAHDFNNILNGIFGFASLIKRKAEKDSSLEKYSSKIIQLGKSAGGLISQLLVYSRHTDVGTNSVILNQVIDDCVEIIKHTNKKRITINVDRPDFNAVIDGDAPMIQSAILNLFINACDAMEIDGVISIVVRNKQQAEENEMDFISGKNIPAGKYACVSVTDTGCGISQDKLLRIFEPFYTSKGAGYGTGLGLAAVFGCMESHHGFITVNSIVNKGSTFCLYFPIAANENTKKSDESEGNVDLKDILAKESSKYKKSDKPLQIRSRGENEAIPQQSISHSPIQADNKKRNTTIMIIDDEPSILESLSEYLIGMNYNVIKCDTGRCAIDTFKSNKTKIDVIILDMVLPDIGGREVYEKLYEVNSELIVIIMTGYSTISDLEHVKKLGARKVLYKPFDYNILGPILQEIIKE